MSVMKMGLRRRESTDSFFLRLLSESLWDPGMDKDCALGSFITSRSILCNALEKSGL